MSEPAFEVVDDIITAKERDAVIKAFVQVKDEAEAPGDYEQMISMPIPERFPSLEERILARFPGYRIVGFDFFGGRKKGGEYSGWHTGLNFTNFFKAPADVRTLWIPLQDLTRETGGQLHFYKGKLARQLDDILRAAPKVNNAQRQLVSWLFPELNREAVTMDVTFGQAVLFQETMPHAVDPHSKQDRYVLSIRLVNEDAEVDGDLLESLRGWTRHFEALCKFELEVLRQRAALIAESPPEARAGLRALAALGTEHVQLLDCTSQFMHLVAITRQYTPDRDLGVDPQLIDEIETRRRIWRSGYREAFFDLLRASHAAMMKE